MFHWPGLQNRQQTVSWRHWIRNCPNVLADWRQCCYLNLSTSQSQFSSQWELGAATEELQYLINFNASITQCMAKVMEHPSDFAFVSMANVTLEGIYT